MPNLDNYEILENTALSNKLGTIQHQLSLLGTAASPRDDQRIKEILNLTNGIRVDIDDMVKCGSLRYDSHNLRSRIGRSSPDKIMRRIPEASESVRPVRNRNRDSFDDDERPMAPRK